MNELELYKGNRITLMACSSCNAKCSDCYIGYTGNRTPDDLYNIAYLLMNDGKHVRIDGAEVLTNLDYLKTLDSKHYLVILSEYYNRPNHPPIPVLIVKLS